jgi:hypothetical protein
VRFVFFAVVGDGQAFLSASSTKSFLQSTHSFIHSLLCKEFHAKTHSKIAKQGRANDAQSEKRGTNTRSNRDYVTRCTLIEGMLDNPNRASVQHASLSRSSACSQHLPSLDRQSRIGKHFCLAARRLCVLEAFASQHLPSAQPAAEDGANRCRSKPFKEHIITMHSEKERERRTPQAHNITLRAEGAGPQQHF